MNTPTRGFDHSEFHQRLAAAQKLMTAADLDALLLTTEPGVRYFTGFLTRFWESPTRPWFLIVPAAGKPVAVIPTIGAVSMAKTWIDDIRTWSSPDPVDDGVSLLANTLRDVIGTSGRIGLPMGPETHLRMPLGDFWRLSAMLPPLQMVDDDGILRRLRMVKSPAEIAKIETACAIAQQAFAHLDTIVRPGLGLDAVFRRFQMALLEEGADWVPYLAGGAGQNGYADAISPASTAALEPGDILMLDTGLMWDGYFCDFDRNVAIAATDTSAQSAHERLIDATHAGFEAVRPGASAAGVFHAMEKIVAGGGGADIGRFGHGLGMQLTEWPSLIAGDHTVLEAGMVLTLEPSLSTTHDRMMVHEENIVVTDTGAAWLSHPWPAALKTIG